MPDGSNIAVKAAAELRPGLYQPDHPEILREIGLGYSGDREAYEHDTVVSCTCCERKFWCGYDGNNTSMFDSDILSEDGAHVCDDCVTEYLEAASYDPIREHGTLYARGGRV